MEASVLEVGVESLWLTIPAGSQRALRWLLLGGYRIDAFHEILLGSDDSLNLDRYLMTQSFFIW